MLQEKNKKVCHLISEGMEYLYEEVTPVVIVTDLGSKERFFFQL